LSGGEKKRLQLLSILMKNPNFLILDEPTNDLDIDTLNVLEEFLTNYTGVLMIVSHDRYLLDKLTDQLFIMEGKGHVRIYNGNYSSYRLELEEAKQVKKAEPIAAAPIVAAQPKKNKLSYKETKEYESLEHEITSIEVRIKQCNDELNISGIAADKLSTLVSEISKLNEELDNKTMRWMELSELKES
jgi:ABC transport system ATP-binding/permease protein